MVIRLSESSPISALGKNLEKGGREEDEAYEIQDNGRIRVRARGKENWRGIDKEKDSTGDEVGVDKRGRKLLVPSLLFHELPTSNLTLSQAQLVLLFSLSLSLFLPLSSFPETELSLSFPLLSNFQF